MTKVKRSFFEKLTGSKKIEPEEMFRPEIESRQPTNIYDEETEIMMSSSSFKDDAEENVMENDNNEGQLTIDVYQTENDIVIKSTIAGVKPEDLDVTITNDMVTIRGERKNEEQVEQENYYYQECYWGSFSRSVILPTDVISDKLDASMKNGILTIRLPKADATKTKKIQVRGF